VERGREGVSGRPMSAAGWARPMSVAAGARPMSAVGGSRPHAATTAAAEGDPNHNTPSIKRKTMEAGEFGYDFQDDDGEDEDDNDEDEEEDEAGAYTRPLFGSS